MYSYPCFSVYKRALCSSKDGTENSSDMQIDAELYTEFEELDMPVQDDIASSSEVSGNLLFAHHRKELLSKILRFCRTHASSFK